MISNTKTQLKTWAREITNLKNTIKTSARLGKYVGAEQNKVRSLSWKFRHYLIAYCLVRGKTYEQVEPKVRPGNEADLDYVNKLIEGWKNAEALRAS